MTALITSATSAQRAISQRPLVDHAVVERACFLVGWVRGLDELTSQRAPQIRDFCCVEHDVSFLTATPMKNGFRPDNQRAG